MGNIVDRVLFPIERPVNLHTEVSFIKHSHVEHVYIKNGKTAVLYSHGNNCTLDQIYDFLKIFSRVTGWSVMAYEYPNNATADRANEAIACAYDELKTMHEEEDIILVGRSIGTGPTLWLADRVHNQIRFVAVVSAFTSIRREMPWWLQCVAPMISERFDNVKMVESIECPIFFLHGAADTVIPSASSKELFLRHSNERSQLFEAKDYDHNNIWELLPQKIREFDGSINV